MKTGASTTLRQEQQHQRGRLRQSWFSSSATVDERSLSWIAVDTNRRNNNILSAKHDQEDASPVATIPDPLAYLRGFDACAAVTPFRQALVETAQLQPGMSVLNVGCGLAGITPLLRERVGPTGTIVNVDLSHDMIRAARELHQNDPDTVFQVGSVYDLRDIASNSFDVVMEDRMLQHLTRPREAVLEMLRVCRPGGSVVVGEPDWRTFVLDVTAAGHDPLQGEAGKRWGQNIRPPPELAFDLGQRTQQVLAGAIPHVSTYSYIGAALPRLLQSVGTQDVNVTIVPTQYEGRQELEMVVPVTHLATLAANHRSVTFPQSQAWLQRLDWEEKQAQQPLFGSINFYIGRGQKPVHHTLTAQVEVVSQSNDTELVEQITKVVNEAYRHSDYRITLSTDRIPAIEIVGMIDRRELLIAKDPTTSEILGVIQMEVKGTAARAGLSDVSGVEPGDKVGEFFMLAVKNHKDSEPGTTGVGSLLVRAAEAKCREEGCGLIKLGVLCPNVPAEDEPAYKQWLQQWYLKLGYEQRETLSLQFEPDQIRGMHSYLGQAVPCKCILFHKML